MFLENHTKFQLNAKDFDGRTGFYLACERGHTNTVEQFVHVSSKMMINLRFNETNNWGKTAFHIACKNGHTEIVEIIMKFKCYQSNI